MVQVLGISLFEKNIEQVIEEILVQCKKAKLNHCISATGAHGIIEAKKNHAFKLVLDSFFLNLPDGMPGVWVGRLKGAKKMQRCYGPDFFMQTMISTGDKSINHFLCGGREGVAEELKKVCSEKFGNQRVVGVYCPPFREMNDAEMEELAQKINYLNTNIVWVGISTPKQERFAYRLSKMTNVHFLCTVGAAFDFHTGKVKQAPKWVQKIGLEWLFRLMWDPKRLWKRYFEVVPLFIWYNFLEVTKGEFYKSERI